MKSILKNSPNAIEQKPTPLVSNSPSTSTIATASPISLNTNPIVDIKKEKENFHEQTTTAAIEHLKQNVKQEPVEQKTPIKQLDKKIDDTNRNVVEQTHKSKVEVSSPVVKTAPSLVNKPTTTTIKKESTITVTTPKTQDKTTTSTTIATSNNSNSKLTDSKSISKSNNHTNTSKLSTSVVKKESTTSTKTANNSTSTAAARFTPPY